MNEAMPPWRTFGAGAAGPASGRVPAGQPPAQAPRTGPPTPLAARSAQPPTPASPAPARQRAWWHWLAPLLAAVGGLLAGLSLAIAVLLLPSITTPPPEVEFGEPIGFVTTAGAEPDAVTSSGGIVVDVAGAVTRPGLHRLADGDRVGDAIAAAGGFGPRADLVAASVSLNLAEPLTDGAKVLVPELGTGPAMASSVAGGGRIDLNLADQAELESLPGIGPVTARKILDARAERRFGSVEELRTRGLVGEAVYADIKNLVAAG